MNSMIKRYDFKSRVRHLILAMVLGVGSFSVIAAEQAATTASSGTLSGPDIQAPSPLQKTNTLTPAQAQAQCQKVKKLHRFPATTNAGNEFLGVFDNLSSSQALVQALQNGTGYNLPENTTIEMLAYYGANGAPMPGFPSLNAPFVATMLTQDSSPQGQPVGPTFRIPYIANTGQVADFLSNPNATLMVTSITGLQPQEGGGLQLDPMGTISKPTAMVLVIYTAGTEGSILSFPFVATLRKPYTSF